MLNYIAAFTNNIANQSLGLLVAGRPVAGTELLGRPVQGGIHLPVPTDVPKENQAREAPPVQLAMLLSDSTRHLLGIQRATDFSGYGAGTEPPPPDEKTVEHSTGASAATQAVSLASRIGNRRQALAALRDFEAQREARLPQLSAGGRRGVTLSAGIVQFQDLTDLLTTFPCAVSLPGLPLAGSGAFAESVSYPHGEGFLAVPRKALLRDREVVVAHDLSNARRVRYTHDLRQWMPAEVYTDSVVEAEKLAMWTRIFTEASGRVTAAPADA